MDRQEFRGQMIQTVVVFNLLADEELSELVGTRVFPMRIPQKQPIPAVVYQVISDNPVNTFDGDRSVDSITLQVSCWASTYAEAQELAAAVRRIISGISAIAPVVDSIIDDEDPETRNYRVILNFSLWNGLLSPDGFRYITSSGDADRTGVALPSAVVTDGFYLVFKNGQVMKEGEDAGFYFNESRDRVIFVEQLGQGEDLDEVLVIYQPVDGPEFERVEFNGTDNPDYIDLPSNVIEDGYYALVINGKFSKEGDRYEIDPGLGRVNFLGSLEADDEGVFVYQKTATPTFARVLFNGDDDPDEVSLPSEIIAGGLYIVVVNGFIAKEGSSGRYMVNFGRNKILFNQSLEGGDDKDEGFVIYQDS